MTYLSRVELNPYRRETIAALSSPQMMHAAVMASFPSTGPIDGGRVLWRVDKVGVSTFLLIQSSTAPDLHHIVDQFGRPATGQGWDSIDYDQFLDTIEDGQTFRFRLKANPVHSIPGDGRGKVKAHVTVDQQREWLTSRAERNGFRIVQGGDGDSFDVVDRSIHRFRRGDSVVTLSMATYEGILEVTDRDTFVESLCNGIGRAKAYGCGMLSIARVP